MISHESTALLPVAASEVNLEEWLFGLTDEDYQATAKGHKAAGVHSHADGKRGMVNVEDVGGTLIIQHYHLAQGSPSFVEMLSPGSTAFLMHLLPLTVRVRWVMAVSATAETTSTFACKVEIGLPAPVELACGIFGITASIRRHVEEETVGYARDMMRKVQAQHSGGPA